MAESERSAERAKALVRASIVQLEDDRPGRVDLKESGRTWSFWIDTSQPFIHHKIARGCNWTLSEYFSDRDQVASAHKDVAAGPHVHAVPWLHTAPATPVEAVPILRIFEEDSYTRGTVLLDAVRPRE
jgi:hypothetical protein